MKLQYVVKRLKRKLGLRKTAGRNLTILHDDVFLVSYPRSGNTWMRFLLGHTRVTRPLNFVGIESVIPDIYQNSDRELLSVPRPRVLKSHEKYTNIYPRVIYLVRDPRDVAISFYYWRLRTGTFERHGLHLSLTDYLQQFFAEKEFSFAGWGKHVESWMEQMPFLGDRLFTLRYEDIEESPKRVLQRTVEFLQWNISDSAIDSAVKYSEANRMREAEKSLPAAKRQDIPFVREARSHQWRAVFDDRLNAAYWERFGKYMQKFGYDRS